MKKNYYLNLDFISARIGAEVQGYVIIVYKGVHEMLSYGTHIKNDPDRVFDIRRGKIVNKYYKFNAIGDTCSIYNAVLHIVGEQAYFTCSETSRVIVNYQELCTLYDQSWYQEKLISVEVPTKKPLISKEFYARFFNVPAEMLKLGVLFYEKPSLSFGYLIKDGSRKHAIDVETQMIINLPKEKCVFYEARKKVLTEKSNSDCWMMETKKSDFHLGGENNEPLLLEVSYKKLEEAYDRMWYNPQRALVCIGWSPAGEW